MSSISASPTLHLLAGINGAGKTSFYEYFLRKRTPGAEFVNADELARERWPNEIEAHTAEAARLAGERRRELLEECQTFVAETVFSHPSKLAFVEDARSRGFRVVLYHVHVSTPRLARERVATRVSRGGHDVPRAKIDARFPRTLELIRRAAMVADLTHVFDNSGLGRTHTWVMTLECGDVVRVSDRVPDWVRKVYARELVRFFGGD